MMVIASCLPSLVLVLYLCSGIADFFSLVCLSEQNSLTQEASLQEIDNLRKQILRVKGDAVRMLTNF